MCLFKKIKRALKCKSGASIIFILGIMMFLMAIGVSTMAAGAANSGALMRQNEYNKILMLGKSVHDNIMFSLQADPGNEDLLGFQLADAMFQVFDAHDPSINPSNPMYVPPQLPTIDDMEIRINGVTLYHPNPTLSNTDDKIHISSVVFRFPVQDIIDSPAIEFDPIFDPILGEEEDDYYYTPDRVPRTVTINARMVVEVEITARDLRTNGIDRQIVSRAIYEYRNGRLSEIENVLGGVDDPDFLMSFEPDGFSVWELVSYEVIDV